MRTFYSHILDSKPSHVFEQRRVYLADEVDTYLEALEKQLKGMLHCVTPKENNDGDTARNR